MTATVGPSLRLPLGIRRRSGHRSRFGMADGSDFPQRADECRAFLFDAEDGRRHLLVDAVPHRQERLATLALVLDLGIELSVADQPDPGREDGP